MRTISRFGALALVLSVSYGCGDDSQEHNPLAPSALAPSSMQSAALGTDPPAGAGTASSSTAWAGLGGQVRGAAPPSACIPAQNIIDAAERNRQANDRPPGYGRSWKELLVFFGVDWPGHDPVTLEEMNARVGRWAGWRPFRDEVARLLDCGWVVPGSTTTIEVEPEPEDPPAPAQEEPEEDTPLPAQAPGTVTYDPPGATVREGEYLRIHFSATAEHYCIGGTIPDWLTGVTQLGSTNLYCTPKNPILLATRDDNAVGADKTFSLSPYTDAPDVSYPAQTLTVTEDDLLVTNIRVVGRTSNPSNAKTAEWNGIELDVGRDYHEGFSAILDASGSASIIARSSKVAGAQFPAQQSGRRPAKYPIHCGSGDGWVTVREDVVNNSDWPQDQSNFSEAFPKTRAATGDREKVCPPPPDPAPRPRVVSFSAIQSYGDLVLAGQTLHGDRIGEEMTGYVEVSGSASIIGVASKMFKFTYYEHGDGHELKASAFGPVDSGANEVVRFNCGSGSGWARILYFWKGSSSGDTVPYAPYRRFKVCN